MLLPVILFANLYYVFNYIMIARRSNIGLKRVCTYYFFLLLTIFKLRQFYRELEHKYLKKVNSSNRNIRNGKWNVIMVSSRNIYLEIDVHILQAKKTRSKNLRQIFQN